jgi:hypothetical protein
VCGRATVEDYAAMFAGGATKGPAAAAKVTQASAKKGQQAAPPAAAPRPAPPKSLTTTQAKALVELAMERTTTVKNYLIEEKGIDTKRIVQCRVTYDLKDDQSPRVQFAM